MILWNTLKIVAAETQPGREILISKELWEKYMINQENIFISNVDGYTYIKNIFLAKDWFCICPISLICAYVNSYM